MPKIAQTLKSGHNGRMTENPDPEVLQHRPRWWLVGAGALILVALTTTAAISGWLQPLVGIATLGTALGTLGLALYTYQLARATRESVRGAGQQLEEVRAQRGLLAAQAETSSELALSTKHLAESSKLSADAASKARIDAVSPLVDLRVALLEVGVTSREIRERRKLVPDDKWYEAQLEDFFFDVSLEFTFKNVGASPAQVSFGSASSFLERISAERLHMVMLQPGETYVDRLIQRLGGTAAKDGMLLQIAVTYNGLLHGEVFDHIQWNGWITPLRFSSGVATPNSDKVLNASGAQIFRSYPNLERPEEMAKARARLLGTES